MTQRHCRLLAGVLLAALLHGALYVVIMPSWDLFDEPQHLDYALKLRDDRSVPHIDEPVHAGMVRSVAESSWPGWRPLLEPSSDPARVGILGVSYEGYQPPLYYAMVAVLTVPAGNDLRYALYGARLLGPVLLAALAAASWALARAWFPTAGAAVWASAGIIAAFMPAAAEAAGRVNNDLLAAVLIAAGLLAATRLVGAPTRGRALWLGALGAAAVLAKSPGFLLLVVIPVALALAWRQHGLDLRIALLSLAPPLAAAAAWVGFTRERYGVLSGTDAFLGLAVPFQPLPRSTFAGGVWLNAWSSYWTAHDGGAIRTITGLVVVALLAGGIAAVLRTSRLGPALVMTAVVSVGLLAMMWAGNRSGLVHPQGRLLLPMLPGLAALVAGGWNRWLRTVGPIVAAGVCVTMSAVYLLAWFRPLFLT